MLLENLHPHEDDDIEIDIFCGLLKTNLNILLIINSKTVESKGSILWPELVFNSCCFYDDLKKI